MERENKEIHKEDKRREKQRNTFKMMKGEDGNKRKQRNTYGKIKEKDEKKRKTKKYIRKEQ